MGDMGVDVVTMSCRCRRGVVGNGVKVDHGIPGDHVVLLWGDILRGISFEVLGFLVHFEIVRRVIRRGGLNVVGRGSGRRGWATTDGVGVGVVVLVVSVMVGVGLAMGR